MSSNDELYLLINSDVWTKKGGKSFEYSHVVYVYDPHKIVCFIGCKPTGFFATNRILTIHVDIDIHHIAYIFLIFEQNHLLDPIEDMLQKPNHWIPGPKKNKKTHRFLPFFLISWFFPPWLARNQAVACKQLWNQLKAGFFAAAREAEGGITNSKSPPGSLEILIGKHHFFNGLYYQGVPSPGDSIRDLFFHSLFGGNPISPFEGSRFTISKKVPQRIARQKVITCFFLHFRLS